MLVRRILNPPVGRTVLSDQTRSNKPRHFRMTVETPASTDLKYASALKIL
jgi:hypothetical protein